MIPSNIEQR